MPVLDDIREYLQGEVDAGRLMGAALQVSQASSVGEAICVGRRRLAEDGPAVEGDTVFLVASITKPIVVAGLMQLVEKGKVALEDPVTEYVPEFGASGKGAVKIRHLVTHTSGLPDMIDLNREYRAEKRPVSDFVSRICELPLLFTPGTRISYQSTGIAMVGEIVSRIEGTALPDYLDMRLFGPLGLRDTSLGIQQRLDRESDVKIAGEGLAFGGEGTDHDWNSDYWRGFGAPWGGMLTTVAEMTELMRAFLKLGKARRGRIMSEATVRAMIADQTSRMPDLDPRDRLAQRWGLGWRLQTGSASTYGDLVSDAAFGHSGATGTIAWADPERNTTCVLLTNDPSAARRLRPRVLNMVAAACS